MLLFKSTLLFIWKHSPLWLKLSIAISALPLLGFIAYKSWHVEDIKSYVDPIQERNEERFNALAKYQTEQIKLLRDDIREVKQQNSIMFSHILNNKSAKEN